MSGEPDSPVSDPQSLEPLGGLHFRHLLVAIDGSPNAELALSAAVVVAERDHAKLTLICVSPEPWRWGAQTAYAPTLQSELDQEAERTLSDAVKRIPDEIPVTTQIRRGKPGAEIVAAAGAGDYDAVLLGARGLGRIRSMLGSVSNHVLHEAGIAVFIAHAPHGDDDLQDRDRPSI